MYSDIAATYTTALEGVDGLNSVLDYEPRSPTAAPLAYHLLTGCTRGHEGYGVHLTYRTLIRVFVLFEEDETAERLIWGFVNSVPAALEDVGTLGTELLVTTYDIADKTYRALELTLESQEWLADGTG